MYNINATHINRLLFSCCTMRSTKNKCHEQLLGRQLHSLLHTWALELERIIDFMFMDPNSDQCVVLLLSRRRGQSGGSMKSSRTNPFTMLQETSLYSITLLLVFTSRAALYTLPVITNNVRLGL